MAKNITIIRGNANMININCVDAVKKLPIIQENDTIYFTAKPLYDEDSLDSAAVIREDFPARDVLDTKTGIVSLKLKSSTLNIPPAKYVYDLVLKQADSDRFTLMEGKLTIKPAATLRGY